MRVVERPFWNGATTTVGGHDEGFIEGIAFLLCHFLGRERYAQVAWRRVHVDHEY